MFMLPAPELAFDGLVCGTAEECGGARLERCRASMLVVNSGVPFIALQSYWPYHLSLRY